MRGMESFLQITTLDPRWFLCEDLRWHIWKMSQLRTCRLCGTKLCEEGKVSICFVKEGCLCFLCWHRTRAW